MDWPLQQDYYTQSETCTRTEIASGVAAGAEGSWTELIASTTRESRWLVVSVGCKSGSTDQNIDIGTGALASEAALITDIWCPTTHAVYVFPILIASGVRVSARSSNYAGSGPHYANVKIHLLG